MAVHKAGDKEDTNNYRPIAVLPTIAHVFEKLIYGELYHYFTENNLLGNEQFGFRSLHSTALVLGKSGGNWLMNIDNGKMYRAFNNSLTDELIPAFGKICEWLKSNKLALNRLKTEFMIIGISRRLISWTVYLKVHHT